MFDLIDVQGLKTLARLADENLLFDSIWVGDSLFSKPRPDSLALLGLLAGNTTRVQLGVGCMASFPVRDPVIFAYQWATLDVLSQGRMLLAACTGIVKRGGASEEEGRPWSVTDAERSARMTENIEICRALWSGEPVWYEGRFTSLSDIRMAPVPTQQPCPIWIASNPSPDPKRPEAVRTPLRRVARKADGWMTVQYFAGAFKLFWDELSQLLREEGKDPARFPNIAYHNININDDVGAGYAETKRFLDLYYGPVFGEHNIRPWTALGSPEACIEQLRSLRQEGAKAITLRITSWEWQQQLERLTNEVLPFV
jgi:alkanesulfonate monooxygenase SsuD/methylene tetrahydromethanopterin reductase-like flavin-dependent oxidoreductase (luciferase family)